MSYGSISGSGSFVLVGAPQLNTNMVTLINDTTAKQLKLVYAPASSLIWDAGNTANGTTIDAASGTWDMNLGNPVWNSNGANTPWVNAAGATFGGADGTWVITLATNISTTSLTFSNSGYTILRPHRQTSRWLPTAPAHSRTSKLTPANRCHRHQCDAANHGQQQYNHGWASGHG